VKIAEGTEEGQEFPKLYNLILIHTDLMHTLSNIIQTLTWITTTEKSNYLFYIRVVAA
jgi:hypothetical protein